MGQISRCVLLLHNNPPAHSSHVAQASIPNCGLNLLPIPPYSPDLAPMNYHLFPNLRKSLPGRHFGKDNELSEEVDGCLSGQNVGFYSAEMRALRACLIKGRDKEGDYVEI